MGIDPNLADSSRILPNLVYLLLFNYCLIIADLLFNFLSII